MRCEASPVKAPPITRRRMTPPTRREVAKRKAEDGMGEKEQSPQERISIWKEVFSVKVRVEELEGLLGPEDVDVDFRRILKEARDERGRKIFLSSDDLSFLVAEWS